VAEDAGFLVQNAAGQIVFNSNDKILREAGSFVVTDSGSFNASAWQAPTNNIIAAVTDAGLAESPLTFTYTGNIQVNAARADTSRPVNATVRVQLF
jgi:hypothetical protein